MPRDSQTPERRRNEAITHESLQRGDEVHGSSDRAFGLVFATVFLIIATYPLLFGGPIRLWSLAVCAAFAAAAFLAPGLLAPLNRLWTRFGLLLHRIVSPIVLGIMFFAVITPMGVLMRLLGKDPLRLRFDTQTQSYWIERRPPGPKPDSFPDQF
ncbi:MAG TPA: SxtJ family membrane protein [Burkholderiaceae bacterium]|nr:SxtJ family membrane protein [Burkholderiaceae bacterium]